MHESLCFSIQSSSPNLDDLPLRCDGLTLQLRNAVTTDSTVTMSYMQDVPTNVQCLLSKLRRYGLLLPLPWRSPHTTGWYGRIELLAFCGLTPREVALQLTWGQRLVVPGAREAYAVATYERGAMGRSLGAAPCNLCGCWTHSWCEACKTRPPTAICSTCDAAKLLCQSYTSCHQLVYSEASQKPQ